MHLANVVNILEAENIPINSWGGKAKFLFTDESLSDLNCHELQQSKNKLGTTVQPSGDGSKHDPGFSK